MVITNSPMKLVVGLCNPGRKYEGTRHNAGFAVIDTLAARHHVEWEAAPRGIEMPLIFTEADLHAMRGVREAWNPRGLCNPGKIFPSRKACGEASIAYRPHPIEAQGLAQRF